MKREWINTSLPDSTVKPFRGQRQEPWVAENLAPQVRREVDSGENDNGIPRKKVTYKYMYTSRVGVTIQMDRDVS